MLVRPSSRHAADHRKGFVGRTATVPATLGLADTKLRMLAASPMDRQEHVTGGFVDIGDDVDDGAQELLARAHRNVRGGPSRFQIFGQPEENAEFADCAMSCVAGSRRAWQASTWRSAVSQLFSNCAAISRLSGSQAA